MIVYGRNPVREALRGPRDVRRIWATKNAAREPWLTGALGRIFKVTVEPAGRIEELSGSASHQGMCAEVSSFRYLSGLDLLSPPEPLIVALDQVQDPQNLGSICRAAECAGATGLILPERRSAAVTAAVCKASAGAVEHLPVARVRNLVDFLTEAKAASMWCYGAEADAGASYDEVDFRGGVVLVFGSEGRGLRPRVAAACDLLVRIPLRGKVESLSVASAAAVLLFAASKQRYSATE
ncbi:MAG: 23S rRNA (guanosine(2251)-2'-O)-methyltransferase RlmB [Solirubrobacteraceae bacterium]